MRSVEFKFSETKRVKWEYYTGKLTKNQLEELGWEPFQFVLKSDISTYIEGDRDLNRLLAAKAMHEEIVRTCESIMKELHSRTYQLKAFIDYERFIQGA